MKQHFSSLWSRDLGIVALLAAMVVVGVASLLLDARDPLGRDGSGGVARHEVAPVQVTIVPMRVDVVGTREQTTAQEFVRGASARRGDAS